MSLQSSVRPDVAPRRGRGAAAASLNRIGAMILRHVYILRGSWPRILELAYWPTIQMIIWGFISTFLMTNSTWVAQAFGVLLSAVMLWDVMFRGQLGFSLSFLEEMWSRNLGHLFVSPLRPGELVAAMMAMSLIRALIGVVPAMILCIFLYHFSIFSLGPPLLVFFVALLALGWAVGLFVSALILRYGMGAENLAWFVIFMLAPVSAVYYPVAALPGWLQPVAWCLPSAYVFEGMRAILFHRGFELSYLIGAGALDLLYLGLGFGFFLWSFDRARERGQLLQVGE